MIQVYKKRYIVISVAALTACQPAISLPHTADATSVETLFTSADSDISFESKNRRKWGAPVIADLDRDGFPDLLLNDHGYAIKVYWNNGGAYSKGIDVIMGDAHGIAVGDYDKDGDINVVITRGGGSGKNARNAKVYSVSKDRKFTDSKAFSTPLKNMRGRTANFMDGDNDGDLDLLLLGFPSNLKAPNSENYVYSNDGQGDLTYHSSLLKTGVDGEGLLVTDFDNDHLLDLLIYGGAAPMSAHRGGGDLSFKNVSDEILPLEIDHITGVEELDFDNDGDFDLFVTRSAEYTAGETFYDSETQTFAFYTKRGSFRLPDLEIGETFDLQNYQAPWPDQKLFTGEPGIEFKTIGEKHSGRDIEFVSSDALGWPDVTDEKGIYIGYVGNDKWRVAGNTHSPTTGVIHNVKSARPTEPRPRLHNVLLENRGGKFVDITEQAGVFIEGHSSGVAVADYNNDGFQDIFTVERGNLAGANTQTLFLNQGDGTFEAAKNHGISSPELGAIGSEAGAIDYNLDGQVDILYSNERGKWHLYKNSQASAVDANYLTLHIGHSLEDGASPRGALVTVAGCGRSQMRRVGSSGARYSQSLNDMIHFGLGTCKEAQTVDVRWSTGETIRSEISDLNGVQAIGKF